MSTERSSFQRRVRSYAENYAAVLAIGGRKLFEKGIILLEQENEPANQRGTEEARFWPANVGARKTGVPLID